MASKSRKKSRRSRKQNNSLTWIITGAVGVVVLVIVALALAARDDDAAGPGQRPFDPDFEPEMTGAPRVEVVQNEVLDYGNIKLGTTVTTQYTVRNVGDQPLTILGEPRVELVEGC